MVQLFLGANVATILLLWASCAVTYLPPDWHPRLALLSLVFPAFLLANVLFVLFWLVFKFKYVWVPLVGLLACCSFIYDYFPLHFKGAVSDSTLKVVSYNTHSFGGKEARLDDGSNIVVNFLLGTGADIICLQESSKHSQYLLSLEEAGYECASEKEFMICSRLPILSTDTLALPGQTAHCQYAYLLDGQDTIMVVNQHLESNRLSPQVKNAYVEALQVHETDSMRKGLQPVADLLTVAFPVRGQQVDNVQRLVESWLPRPLILCGDFNDTPVSYAHRVLTRHLSSAFTQSGCGLGFTFHDKGFPVRIDHILFSGSHWKSEQTAVCDTIMSSDHYPIYTLLGKKDR